MNEDGSFNETLEVQIIATASTGGMLRQGTATSEADGSWTVQVHQGTAGMALGDVLVLSTGDQGKVRMVGTVTTLGRDRARLSQHAGSQADRRLFPRLLGGLEVRFQTASPQETVDYLAGNDPEGDWVTPDSYMNFSVEGLAFHSPEQVPESSLLILELGLPGSGTHWRCSARLVRSSHDPEDPDYPHRTAVAFLSIPPQATEALAALTTRLQVAMMEP